MAIYLDHNATTPLAREVHTAMAPYLEQHFGNPSSRHRYGRAARAGVERARQQVADLVGAQPEQVVFTAGATEANNLAIKGIAAAASGHIAIGATEHPSVREAAEALATRGWRLSTVAVDAHGRLRPETLQAAFAPDTALVALMWANNETGTLQDIARLGDTVRRAGALLHTDAAQAAGKVEVDFAASGAHTLSLSAHKLYGPKGVGALIVDKTLELEPLLHGGGQERGRRSGTENVAGIVGFGAAAALARDRLAERSAHVGRLRERLESGLRAFDGVEILSAAAERLPNTTCAIVPGIEGETLVMNLDRSGMAVSSGSACADGRSEPSPVLLAMGVAPERARSAIRVSLGPDNSAADIDAFLAALATQLAALRPAARRATA
jgi:cysteine desulfurase